MKEDYYKREIERCRRVRGHYSGASLLWGQTVLELEWEVEARGVKALRYFGVNPRAQGLHLISESAV